MAEWTGKELKRAAALWSEHKTIGEIAKALNRSESSVSHQIKRDRERFPRRRQKWGSLKNAVSFRAEISEFTYKIIQKEARERGISVSLIIRETLIDRFVRKQWKPQANTSTAKVKYSRGSRA